ncbi:uncharacterized protein BO66DRAFT_461478 [Aspergillus aculeatinus CBS 121060]|uniref:Uncharacterized protein n=1 Tax=Aspergillus aculeatinus CBS 121060 TaxID=1448322 RepID=A0ACD1HJE2_9EURO|nr:hypothetical protein BO66DRAFT_461478 [Aspergillus aculeatinus CBS 121060]RAH73592.1 hypothetical protein BO66DRAFT_461478 [Aspergillus aculeatinus CBS 121060]
MGISRLKQHLEPYLDTVSLQDRVHPSPGVATAQAVVIDGPSLVYHVYHRLLSWSNPDLCYPDIQPTCDEVSHGVMISLLHLASLGVTIKKICFDGALPPSKQLTRLARLEKSRKRLEAFRISHSACLSTSFASERMTANRWENVLQSRTLPASLTLVPENHFIVPAVYEDLRERWSKENILEALPSDSFLRMAANRLASLPWADVTVMVPGEADVYCAHLAKRNACSILTNDSDLLLYDIGSTGSVILVSSMSWTRTDPGNSITAQGICPNTVARRLGLESLLPLAFELQSNPRIGMGQLIQRSKIIDMAPDPVPGYSHFAKEYQTSPNILVDDIGKQYPQSLDNRVSEMVSQYLFPETYSHDALLNMYLVMLNEDPKRQCAWLQGRVIRVIGYSLFNLTQPIGKRHKYIVEHIRRGGRVTSDMITLENRSWLSAEIQSLLEQLNVVQAKTGMEVDCPVFWRTFALHNIFGLQSTPKTPNLDQLMQLLAHGSMSNNLDWDDVHILAQIQSVLYSLRILKQLIGISELSDRQTTQAAAFLARLPPLHVLMRSAHEMKKESANLPAKNAINQAILLWGESSDDHGRRERQSVSGGTQTLKSGDPKLINSIPTVISRPWPQRPQNMFELLSDQ